MIKHINTKWGNENGKFGKALLFPYDVNLEKLASSRRWSMEDTEISAREVYISVNCPAVFRLRSEVHFLSVFSFSSYAFPILAPHLVNFFKVWLVFGSSIGGLQNASFVYSF